MTGDDESGPQSSDPFRRVLGPGRGLNGAAASQQELKEANDKLTDALVSLAAARAGERQLREEARELKAEVVHLTEERDTARLLTKHAAADKRLAQDDRDRARYAGMRAGLPDPCSHVGTQEAQQREWTPGRPYLAHQHAWHPKTGECYCACSTGAPAGEMPGTGRHWERCLEPEMCPQAPSLPDDDEQTLSGWALRKTELCWSRNPRLRFPRELNDTELENVIGFLRANAADLCAEEWTGSRPIVPCPTNAFMSAAAWMADMPLMRALLRERKRRRDAASRPRRTRDRSP